MQLFISDMDGTLLGADSLVSARSAEILSRLADEGVLFTVATARTPATVQPLLENVKSRVPSIVMTGAAIWDRQRWVYDNVSFLSADDYDVVSDVCSSHGVHPFVYVLSPRMHLDVYHPAPALSSAERSFVEPRSHLPLKTFHLSEAAPAALARNRSVLMFAIGSIAVLRSVADELKKLSECSLSCYPDIFNPETGCLEVFAPGVSKAAAVQRLKKELGSDELIVFGDNLNDLPMMAVADVAVAVENALPEVKAAADVVIGPNTADSVARYIELHARR